VDIVRNEEGSIEPTINLGDANQRDVVRFATVSYEDALKEGAFYMVTSAIVKDGVKLVCLADGLELVRDTSHRVMVHSAKLVVRA